MDYASMCARLQSLRLNLVGAGTELETEGKEVLRLGFGDEGEKEKVEVSEEKEEQKA